MSMQEFEGRTAAEAAIKACEVFGISRSQLDYKVLKDEGEGMDRRVVIEAEPAKNAAAAASSVAVSRDRPDEGRPPRRGRGNRGDDDGNRRRGRRGGRGRKPRGGHGQQADDGLEKLLNLETVPAERAPAKPEVEGDLSEKAAKAKEMMSTIVEKAGLQLSIHVTTDGEEEVHLDLRGDDEARVIGKKGEALLSMQFLLNRMVSRSVEGEQVIVLDAADYRARRRDALADLAKRLAERAIEEGKVVRLSPMSAHDRRVFHLTLKEMDDVDTRSEGDGLYRNLLIIPEEYA